MKQPSWSISTILLGISIGIFAIIVRMVALGQIPVSLYWDETAMLVDVQSVVATGKDMHGNSWLQAMYPSYGDYKLPVYIVLASLSGWIFDPSAWSLRLVSALAGIGTVTIAGLLAWRTAQLLNISEIRARWYGLATAFVVATSPWSIMFSRTGFEGHLAQFFVAISILCLLLSTKKWWWVFLAAGWGALATYTYFSVRFVWPVVFVSYLGWILAQSHQNWQQLSIDIIKKGVIPLVIFGVLLLPMLNSPLYKISNSFRLGTTSILNSADYPLLANVHRQQAGNTRFDRVFFHRWWLPIQALAVQVSNHLSLGYLFGYGDANLRHGTGHHGLFVVPMILFLLIGLLHLAWHKPGYLGVLLVWWAIALLPASVPLDTPHALRSLNALAPLALIMGWGVLTFGEWSLQTKVTKITGGVYAVIVGVFIIQFLGYYFVVYPKLSAPSWQDGYDELAEVIKTKQNEVGTVWIRSTEDIYYLWLFTHGLYTAQEIQALPKKDYKVFDLGKIKLKEFDWQTATTLTEPVLVTGDADWVAQHLTETGIQPSWLQTITTHDGHAKFTAVIINP